MQVPLNISRTFSSESEWLIEWSRHDTHVRQRHSEDLVNSVSMFVGGALMGEGFRLFRNGGLPLLERRRGPIHEEILFVSSPSSAYRNDFPFSVRFSASNELLADVRGRYWRPASRAPSLIASGETGNFEDANHKIIWYAESASFVGEILVDTIRQSLVEWFTIFEDRDLLKESLDSFNLPLVGGSTALELMISEFGVREARAYWNRIKREMPWSSSLGEPYESEGHSIESNRLQSIVAYYRLG